MSGRLQRAIVTRADWDRLATTDLGPVLPLLPADTQIVVVEGPEGIVGTWAVVRYVHVEGLWIAPAHRKRGRVGALLLAGMREVAHAWDTTVVLTGAESDEVRALIGHFGGRQLPGDHYVLPIGGV
jgi:hypothetical protein